MEGNVFSRSRTKLTVIYTVVMAVFLIALIGLVHKTMEWSFSSEQAGELLDTASNVAEAQYYFNQHPETVLDESILYKNSNARLFFYVIADDGQLMNFFRASHKVEPFIMDIIKDWSVNEGEVAVFSRQKEDGRQKETKLMMTAVRIPGGEHYSDQTVYVGKDVTAMYKGLAKTTYCFLLLGVFALLIASIIGHILSGRAMIPLREAYEKQRQFAADASHELRTPLSVVLASADLLDNDPSIKSPFLKQVIGDVKDEVNKMTRLVSDLLLVARSDNKVLKLQVKRFDLAELIEHTARILQPLAEQKNISLVVGDMARTEIAADEEKIRQLVLILMDNAVKYTADGGRVEVTLDASDKHKVRFSVKDNGIGIAPEDQKKIFDRFYRVDKARSREMGGNGLGLAIARELVNMHHGSISLTSKLGEGTCFTVELKRKTSSK